MSAIKSRRVGVFDKELPEASAEELPEATRDRRVYLRRGREDIYDRNAQGLHTSLMHKV